MTNKPLHPWIILVLERLSCSGLQYLVKNSSFQWPVNLVCKWYRGYMYTPEKEFLSCILTKRWLSLAWNSFRSPLGDAPRPADSLTPIRLASSGRIWESWFIIDEQTVEPYQIEIWWSVTAKLYLTALNSGGFFFRCIKQLWVEKKGQQYKYTCAA